MNEPYILHVDDDTDDRELVRDVLCQIAPSLKVKGVADGSQAITFLQATMEKTLPPRLVLLDLYMPVMNGRQTLTALKEDPGTADLHIIVFTTSYSLEDQLFCRRYGVDMLTKPAKYAQLKDVLTRVVGDL